MYAFSSLLQYSCSAETGVTIIVSGLAYQCSCEGEQVLQHNYIIISMHVYIITIMNKFMCIIVCFIFFFSQLQFSFTDNGGALITASLRCPACSQLCYVSLLFSMFFKIRVVKCCVFTRRIHRPVVQQQSQQRAMIESLMCRGALTSLLCLVVMEQQRTMQLL